MSAIDKIKTILDADLSDEGLMFSTPHYYNKTEVKPKCEHHSGGDDWHSDVCVCFMTDGTFELNRYIDSEDFDGWNSQSGLDVVAWMEL